MFVRTLAAAIGITITVNCYSQTIVEYTSATIPTYYQGFNQFLPLYQHPNGQRAQNPNFRHPWIVPSGCRNVKGLMAKRWLIIPEGQYILAWRVKTSPNDNSLLPLETTKSIPWGGTLNYTPAVGDNRIWRWRYPVGTVVQERLSVKEGSTIRAFLFRTRGKTGHNEWDYEDETELGPMPKGYRLEIQECMNCHADPGKHVSRLRRHNEIPQWYHWLRGNDTIYSFRPLTPDGRIKKEFQDIVKIWKPGQPNPNKLLPKRELLTDLLQQGKSIDLSEKEKITIKLEQGDKLLMLHNGSSAE